MLNKFVSSGLGVVLLTKLVRPFSYGKIFLFFLYSPSFQFGSGC